MLVEDESRRCREHHHDCVFLLPRIRKERAGRSGSRSHVTVPALRSLTVATSPLAELWRLLGK